MIVYCDFITAVLLHNLPYLSITRKRININITFMFKKYYITII